MKKTAIFIFSASLLIACNKKKLDANPDSTQIIPKTVKDYQGMLDYQKVINFTVFLGELGADNYFVPENTWEGLDAIYKNSYIWAEKPFQDDPVNDWNICYTSILYANTVLEGVSRLTAERDSPDAINATSQAYFHRAHSFFQLAQLFCKVYDPATAQNDLGIPLRLQSDITLRVHRSTVQETYDRIIADLLIAEELLPVNIESKTRPGKLAAIAMLARVYLSMSAFEKALQYANKALTQYNTLIDYNSIANTLVPFKQFNNEVIWHTLMGGSIFNADNNCAVDTTLYQSYDDNDRRKQLFYGIGTNNRLYFKGTYAGFTTSSKFCGLAVDELYLTRAECFAQKGMLTEAMNDLDTLMVKRWKNNGTFKPFQAVTREEALQKILTERRKELPFRGLRWMDLRRLNWNGADIKVRRAIKGDTITLFPNSLRYVYPIPHQELVFNPMQQNDR